MRNNLAEVLLEVRNKTGLHMRAITLFVKQASRFSCKVTVEKNGEAVDGKSITSLMALGAEKGSKLRIVAVGDGAQQVVGKLKKLIDDKFGEK
ncbi:HPr family phosphocarrier protein [candidate division NPL-UPA2 bacterium Unc8]|uniref:HPr family phosphocarrier protein n=1 Tax=candidate division NPL-UPA2 bacterium Unc8 TaxID=1980939 RepID=A0A399FXB3_UNCN2|nr:HPr-like protein Crh [Bacillota bacterium]RIH99861.1 MAG: HPr family phosphocarrier protein [candidate division NPL-UPA2 bacterium Unc8]